MRQGPLKPLTSHLKAYWHIHLSIVSVLAAAVAFSTGLAAPAVYHHVHGGFARGPMPPVMHITGGITPTSYSLTGSIVRVHNQGSSNSCVGQTLSTILEIETHEFAVHHPNYAGKHPFFHPDTQFSAGYVWNLATGGLNVGATYSAAFQVLQNFGDAPLPLFPPDGATDFTTMPGPVARKYGHWHRISSWRTVEPTDRHTIEEEIVHGRPVALAIPVYDSFYNNWTGQWPVISSNYGQFWFWHSITIVGYNSAGVVILNSWGPNWGYHGLATLTWNLIAQDNAGLIAQIPHWPKTYLPVPRPVYVPTVPPRPTPTPIPTVTPALPTATPKPIATSARASTRAPDPGNDSHGIADPATPVPPGEVPSP